jgi:hypothetical protein
VGQALPVVTNPFCQPPVPEAFDDGFGASAAVIAALPGFI